MNTLFIYIKTINSLGLSKIINVLYYRLISNNILGSIFLPNIILNIKKIKFSPAKSKILKIKSDDKSKIIDVADSIIEGKVSYFSHHNIKVGKVPNWFLNPFNMEKFINNKFHWTKLNDFNMKVGDIKNIWELSRFNWLGSLALAYSVTNNNKYLNTINNWVNDWYNKNLPNQGPNWRCGQETSIRALNLLLANEIIGSSKNDSGLIDLLKNHINRIESTKFYAIAQNNNHGITEGIALFLLGEFLWKKTKDKKYKSISKKGRKLIHNQIEVLIMKDGSFCQYSITYHRMILDLLSINEIMIRRWNLEPFSELFYSRIELAINWFSNFIDPISGDAPNMGANDGTYLFNYNNNYYRDFRPTLFLACSIFKVSMNIKLQSDHYLINLFNIKPASFIKVKNESILFKHGGQGKLVRENGMALMRIPNYKFRPSQSDALHLDIWQDGINWIRDLGSFSYSLLDNNLDEYSGTKGHSTIEFDNSNQMPRLSRFLFGNWLKPNHIKFNLEENTLSSGYENQNNAKHERQVSEVENGWKIIDKVSGDFKVFSLRWILKPGKWETTNSSIKNRNTSLKINSDKIKSFRLIESNESLFYMSESPVPILIIEFDRECLIETLISFNK